MSKQTIELPAKLPANRTNQPQDEDIDVTITPKRTKHERQWSRKKALELRLKGVSFREIAKILGCNHTGIVRAFKPYKTEIGDLGDFKDNRADILAFHQARILSLVTDAEIKKTPFPGKIVSYGILDTKERLERGKSTQNIDYHANIKEQDDLEKRLKELELET